MTIGPLLVLYLLWLAIADHGVPNVLAGARVERVDVRVAGGDIDLVVVDREAALRTAGGRFADAVLPNQIAFARIQRLHDVAGIVDVHHAVVHHRRRLIGAFVHGPHPLELQILYVLRGDLIERAVIGGVIVVANHQPIAGIGIAQHGVGYRRVNFFTSPATTSPRGVGGTGASARPPSGSPAGACALAGLAVRALCCPVATERMATLLAAVNG